MVMWLVRGKWLGRLVVMDWWMCKDDLEWWCIRKVNRRG